VAGSIRSIETFNDFIANRTRDLPACGRVPQPTTLRRRLHERLGVEVISTYLSVRNFYFLKYLVMLKTFDMGCITLKILQLILCIVTCQSDSGRGLDWRLDLLTAYRS
jgi:hypothetical protein